MSSLIVEVCEIQDVIKHPDADALEICVIKGWSSVTRLGQFKKGDLAIYVPIGSALPQDLIDELGIGSFLKRGECVKAARLRGVVSNGLLMMPKEHHKLGDNVAAEYGITKWEPPALQAEGAIPMNQNFLHYTSLENFKNFPDVFQDGEEVIIREKIHGTNGRCGNLPLVEDPETIQFCVGGHNLQYDNTLEGHTYVSPPRRYDLQDKLKTWEQLCYEIYGLQDLKYGLSKGRVDLVAFDMIVNGNYVDDDVMQAWCDANGIPTAPILYRGPYSKEVAESFNNAMSVLHPETIMEGVVIKPVKESYDLKLGRKILKVISDRYLLRKGGTEFH